MEDFLGEYEVTLDPKGRFLLPAGFKKQLPEDANAQFVMNRGIDKCLTLYPIKVWEPIIERISRLNDFEADARRFSRRFLSGATKMELDSAGRLLIPQVLKDYAALERDIVLIARINKIEIWNKTAYDELLNSYEDDAEFSKLASQVMGGNNIAVPST
ncbi:MAG: division/cell wall cluster transcriptional repressor MraZ [Chitinophagaceae bacterium]|nr:division/cell wall cluster transcriptional repressor MraZ [Chitinophagaceae bacterium]